MIRAVKVQKQEEDYGKFSGGSRCGNQRQRRRIVMNEDGKVYGSHYITYKLITPSRLAEHDPEDYWRAVAGTIRESIRQAK